MTKPIGVRIDKETRAQIEKDAKKMGVALSTYASKILSDWTNIYKPLLDEGNVFFPIPLLRIFYNFVKEDDYETIANLFADWWIDSVKARTKNPNYEDYLENLELWMNLSSQKLSVLGNHPIKHVIRHSWGLSYSKITCHIMKRSWESLGYRFEEVELKQNMFSYNIHENDPDK